VKRPAPPALAHLGDALETLRREDRLRSRAEPPGALSFCSNDYLGLAGSLAPAVAAGAGASRMIAGEHNEHAQLERALAEWLDAEQTLLFSSGYAANVGALSALIGRDDWVVSDALNHASIIDGVRLARAEVAVVPHLDVPAVEAALERRNGRRAWVVTESYFSMDGDSPDLARLRAVCDAAGAGLVVDEAHALGVFGPDGRGLCAEAGVVPDVLVGTLGKAFGAAGAFVAGCRLLGDWLWNRARSHVFSTGMSPATAAAALANFERAARTPALRATAVRLGDRLRDGLRTLGADVRGHGPIVPWALGSEASALQAAASMRELGVHAVAIRPPTVPKGTSRIRFALTARHTEQDVDRAIEAARAALSRAVSRETP
jgi:8-amino-7-oxononanoate synthase